MKLVLNIVGMLIVLAICFLISWDRKNVEWKKVGIALIAEIIIAIIIVKVPLGQKLISLLSNGLTAVINCGNEGLTFVFGDLFTGNMSIFIIKSLGNIIFVSALVSVLYYLGVIGFVVKWIGKGVGKLMGTTEVESFVAVANMFLGHTDSPILVSKYLKDLTDSEIFLILVSGMGSMSASILGGYHALGIPMEYLLIASAMVPLGSIMISKIILPQTEKAKSITDVKMDNKGDASESTSAATKLMTEDGVAFIVEPATSGASIATYPVADQNQVPVISPSATQVDATMNGDSPYEYAFRICFEDSYQGKAMAKFGYENLGKKKAVIINEVSDYGKGLTKEFTQNLKI